MIRTSRVLFVVLMLVAIASRADDSLVHEPTGVRLPGELLGFVRGDVIDHERSSPGQGMSVPYREAGHYSATLTIATFGLNPFPSSIDDPVIAEIRKLTVAAVLARAKTREPLVFSANSRHTGAGRWEAPDSAKTPVLVDTFIVYIGGRATNDVVNIWLAKHHVWKLRVTRDGEAGETWVAFAKALVALSTAEPQQTSKDLLTSNH